jgi:hypothetical protein
MKTRREFFGYAAAPVVALAATTSAVVHRVADDIEWPEDFSGAIRRECVQGMMDLIQREAPGDHRIAHIPVYDGGVNAIMVSWTTSRSEFGVWRPEVYQRGEWDSVKFRDFPNTKGKTQ